MTLQNFTSHDLAMKSEFSENLFEFYLERKAVRIFDGCMPESVAEKKAREDVSRYPATANEGSDA